MGCTNSIHSRSGQFIFMAFDQLLCSGICSFYGTRNKYSSSTDLYVYMRRAGVCVDRFTIPSVLKACGNLSNVLFGEEVHGFSLKSGMTHDIFVLNSLILFYSECGFVEHARKVFDSIPKRDAISWSTIIRTCSKHRMIREGMHLISEMANSSIKPTEGGLICSINLAADVQNAELGKEIHSYAMKNNSMDNMSPRLSSSLIDMYGKCGNVEYSSALFTQMGSKCVVSFTSMIASFIRNNFTNKAEALFVQMMVQRFFPNDITMLSLFISCGVSQALTTGKKLHAFNLKNGFPLSIKASAALIEMYGKCADVRSARKVFNTIKDNDATTFTSMISAYCSWGFKIEAFELFKSMVESKVKPNAITMVSLISLCAEMGALEEGKWLQTFIKEEQIGIDLVLRTSLLDMYAKCGDIEEARGLFEEAQDADTCMWNAMINGCGINGLASEALEYFRQMRIRSVNVNHATFVGVLNACAHSGRVEEGKRYFDEMGSSFGLVPRADHYGCMVDLYGRAGLLEEAYGMILSMPTRPYVSVWVALLAACRVHKNPEMAEVAGKRVGELDPHNLRFGVLMANVYAAEKRWNDVALVRKEMKEAGMRKEPGFSVVEIDCSMHKFVMGDAVDCNVAEICKSLGNTSVVDGGCGFID